MTRLAKFAGVIRSGAMKVAAHRLSAAKRSLRIDQEKLPQQKISYQPESWRNDETRRSVISSHSQEKHFLPRTSREFPPDIREQTRVLDLLGRVNYKIIKGNVVYVEVGGVVYKTLYGGYWRSVFTGIEHYLLRCEQVSGSIWARDETDMSAAVDLPISYSNEGWTASGHSLSFMLSRE